MNWDQGYTARYYGRILDPESWREIDTFEIIDGHITRNSEDLMEAASLTVPSFESDAEKYVRIYLDAAQDANVSHNALFTGLTSSPQQRTESGATEHSLTCYSVLKPAKDIFLAPGWFAPADTPAGEIIQNLLKVIPAPVEDKTRGVMLQDNVIAEQGETNLTMLYKILKATNTRAVIQGDGIVTLEEQPEEEAATFSDRDVDIIEDGIDQTYDWFECPNVFIAIANDLYAVARDEDEDSPLSIQNRGREIQKQETNVQLAANETIAEYAERRLKEEQTIAEVVSYQRRYLPNVTVSDYIRLNTAATRGLFQVTSQSVELTTAARTSETVQRVPEDEE